MRHAPILVFVFGVLCVLASLILLLWGSWAPAWEIDMTWTMPTTNADTLDCQQEGGPVTNLYGTYFQAVRPGYPDTLSLGTVLLPDTAKTFVFADTVCFVEILSRAEKMNGKRSCNASHYLIARPLTPYVPPTGGLTGNYYRWVKDGNGIRQFGPWLATRVDTTIDFEWGTGVPMPGVPADSFATRWTGSIFIAAPGTCTFYVSSEDGFRFFIDDMTTPKLDWWNVTYEQEITVPPLTLSAGAHAVKIEYFSNMGHSACHWKWSGPNIPKQIVPRGALSPQ